MENFLSILKTESSKSLIAPSRFILILTIFIVIVASITNISLAQTSVGGRGGGGGTYTPLPKQIHSWTKITPGVATIMKITKKEI